jgi:Tol biopolymer transport system component
LVIGIASIVALGGGPPSASADIVPACTVRWLNRSAMEGLKVYSPDGSKYVLNKEDDAGVAQIYVATTGTSDLKCITCVPRSGGPAADRFKMQPHWHPSGKWIFMAVERDDYTVPAALADNEAFIEGQLQNGLWTNMWAVTPDGRKWFRLTDFSSTPGTPDGFTGVAFTPDGKKAVWSQIVDGNILLYWPFGRWELTMADVQDVNGTPKLTNLKNITPPGMNWNEPGNFSADNKSLIFAGSMGQDAEGMDEYVLDITNGKLVNLTSSPTIWDEHGVFSPDGSKIIFMSSYPYRDDPNASTVMGIKTEFMMMNSDGSGLTQLTHFLEPGYPEYSFWNPAIAANAAWAPTGRTVSLRRLFFPNYDDWEIEFTGACGNTVATP